MAEEQEKGHLPQGRHQHHEGLAVPAALCEGPGTGQAQGGTGEDGRTETRPRETEALETPRENFKEMAIGQK